MMVRLSQRSTDITSDKVIYQTISLSRRFPTRPQCDAWDERLG